MAAETARSLEETDPRVGDERQLVVFQLENEDYGIDIYSVQRLIQVPEITPVPRAPDYVAGVIEVRGDILPVLNLKKRFGFSSTEIDKDGRIIIAEIGKQIVGFSVDAISEVTRLASDEIEPPSEVVAGVDTEFIAGIGKQYDGDKARLIIVLDLEKVLSGEEQVAPSWV